jgi:uncharacterized membrane protein
MGLAFGSIYPDFNHENIARVPTGFGAMLYIFWGLVLLAVSSALQFITFCIYAFSRVGYIRFMMRYSGISTFMLILDIIICVGICVFCYRASERALQYEQ